MASDGDLWVPLWVNDYLGDTMHLSTLEHGAYLLLLMAYWKRQGPLPNDEEHLRKITRCSPAEWAKIRGAIAAFFTITDAGWVNKRSEAEIENARAKKCAKVTAGKIGGLAKTAALYLPNAKQAPSKRLAVLEADQLAQPIADQLANSSPSPSPSPSEKKEGIVMGNSAASGAVGGDKYRGPKTAFEIAGSTNHPTLEVIQAWAKKHFAEFTPQEIESVWHRFEAVAVDGFWMWGGQPVRNWVSAFTRSLAEDSVRLRKTAAQKPQRGIAAQFNGEAATEEIVCR